MSTAISGAAVRKGARVLELDAIRGLAALAVVFFHYGYKYDVLYGHTGEFPFSVKWGQYGVQIFFMISGFVILMTLERSARIADFAVSRFSRLYPAYWAALILTTAIVQLLGVTDLIFPPSVFLINLTMLQMAFGVPNIDGAYWTLFVELCFYVSMAACAAVGLLKHILWVMIPAVVAAWLAPMGIAALGYEPPYLLYLIVWSVPFFAIGMSFYCLSAKRENAALCWAVILVAMAVSFEFGQWRLFGVAAIGASLFALLLSGKLGFLGARPFVALGALSYTLYLVHESIGWAIIRRLEASGYAPELAVAVAIGVAFASSWLLTTYVERPALRYIRDVYKARKLRTVAA